MLFASTLLDYVQASGDTETGKDLYPIAAKQFRFFASNYTNDLRYEIPSRDIPDGGSGWHFVDCKRYLFVTTSFRSLIKHCRGTYSRQGSC
jgi:alpha-L-rhamnosidase